MRAVVEINFIANLHTRADPSEMRLSANTGLEECVHVVGTQSIQAADESRERIERGTVIDSKIHEAAF
jgi:hypothetical protein